MSARARSPSNRERTALPLHARFHRRRPEQVISFAFAFFALTQGHSWVDLMNHDLLYCSPSDTA